MNTWAESCELVRLSECSRIRKRSIKLDPMSGELICYLPAWRQFA
jgi:hypothetical protein